MKTKILADFQIWISVTYQGLLKNLAKFRL